MSSPDEVVSRGADWALRVDIDPSFETPVTFVVSGAGATRRLAAYRFKSLPRSVDSLDLDYVASFPAVLDPPVWLKRLDRSDGETGFDGQTVRIRYVDDGGAHEVVRWAPWYETKPRDLTEFVELISTLYQVTGVRPRPQFLRSDPEGEQVVAFEIPLSPACVAAMRRVGSIHPYPVEELLADMCLEGGGECELEIGYESGQVRGSAPRRLALHLAYVLGRWAFASERHVFNELDRVAVGRRNDPFRNGGSEEESGGAEGVEGQGGAEDQR